MAEPALHPDAALSLALALVDSSNAPLLLLDGDLSVISVSTSFCRAFYVDRASAVAHPVFVLALQLRSRLKMGQSCGSLVSSSPMGPGKDVSGPDLSLGEADGDSTDFLNRPAD